MKKNLKDEEYIQEQLYRMAIDWEYVDIATRIESVCHMTSQRLLEKIHQEQPSIAGWAKDVLDIDRAML